MGVRFLEKIGVFPLPHLYYLCVLGEISGLLIAFIIKVLSKELTYKYTVHYNEINLAGCCI